MQELILYLFKRLKLDLMSEKAEDYFLLDAENGSLLFDIGFIEDSKTYFFFHVDFIFRVEEDKEEENSRRGRKRKQKE